MSRRSSTPASEDSIIRLVCERFGGRSAFLKKGIGDDAAVVHPAGAREYWVVTSDMLLEEVDFRRGWQTPEQLGWKALAVNLSDLAAMGARPRFYLVNLGLPAGITGKWITAFYEGLAAIGDFHGAILIGGDLSRSPLGIQISIGAIGETRRRKVVYRSGGSGSDVLYVTGILGKSAAGLNLLQSGRTRGRTIPEREALVAHRAPRPRCAVGEWLAQSGLAAAMMDLSDGLSMDLPRLCSASVTGAELYACELPKFEEAEAWGCDPLELAFHGAEDFELLFSVPEKKAPRLRATYPRHFPPLSPIGRLTRKPGVVWMQEPGMQSQPLPNKGFDHFRKGSHQ